MISRILKKQTQPMKRPQHILAKAHCVSRKPEVCRDGQLATSCRGAVETTSPRKQLPGKELVPVRTSLALRLCPSSWPGFGSECVIAEGLVLPYTSEAASPVKLEPLARRFAYWEGMA